MKYSKDIGPNWHLRFRLIIQELKEELELTQIHLNIAERKLKKYEDDNIRSTRNRKNNNVVKLSGRIPKGQGLDLNKLGTFRLLKKPQQRRLIVLQRNLD